MKILFKPIQHTARILAIALAAVSMTACTTYGTIEKANTSVAVQEKRTIEVFAKTTEQAKVVVPSYKRVPGLWISDRTVDANVQVLPSSFDVGFVLRERKPLSLGDVAELLRSRTGLNVIITGERLSTDTFFVDHVGSVKSLIDSVTSKAGVTWSWQDNTLLIQQSVVRTFAVNRSGIKDLKSASSSRIDAWKELVDGIQVISPTAKVSVARASNSITVADKPVNMARIAALLEADADSADKQVMVHWQLVNVTGRKNGEAGVDLSYLTNMVGNGGALSFATPAALTGLTTSVLKFEKTADSVHKYGALKGSTAALALLNETGTAYVAIEGIEPIKNNAIRKFGREKSITYRAESTPGNPTTSATGVTTASSAGIKQSEVKVGLDGTFGATIYDNESMDFMFDISLKVLDALREDGSSGYILQSPETTKRYSLGEDGIRIKQGGTYIISAEQSTDISFDRRGVLPGAASVLGGSEKSSEKSGLWLLLVTPIITQKGV